MGSVKVWAEAEVKAVGTEEVLMVVHPVTPGVVSVKAGAEVEVKAVVAVKVWAEAEVKAVGPEEVLMVVQPVTPGVVSVKAGAEVEVKAVGVVKGVGVVKVGQEVGSLLEKRLSGICAYPVRDPKEKSLTG